MSFREKTAWISALSMAGIYGFYFLSLGHTPPHASAFRFGGLLETVVALAAVQVVLIAAAALFSPREAKAPRDERDKLIELRAARVGYAALATGIATACFFGAFDPPVIYNANGLLFILVTAEILRSACQIIQYRRSA